MRHGAKRGAAAWLIASALGTLSAHADDNSVAASEDAVVALLNRRTLACSGVIIAPRHVLTARHCLPIAEVRVGASAGRGQRVKVQEAYVPPNRLDIAVLRLEQPVSVPPVALGTELSRFPKTVEVGGFGAEDARSAGPAGTRHFRLATLVSDGCERARAHTYGCQSGFEFVIPRGRGSDTCQGDSGGPVLERTRSGWQVIGVTSRAVHAALLACGDGGVYVRVDVTARWIRDQIRKGEP